MGAPDLSVLFVSHLSVTFAHEACMRSTKNLGQGRSTHASESRKVHAAKLAGSAKSPMSAPPHDTQTESVTPVEFLPNRLRTDRSPTDGEGRSISMTHHA